MLSITAIWETAKTAWEHRAALALAALVAALACLKIEVLKNKDLYDQLAAKPKIEVHTETKTLTRIVKGPVRVEFKTVTAPDGTRTTDRILSRESEVKTVDSDASKAMTSTPVCPSQSPAGERPWLLGASASALHPGEFGFKFGRAIFFPGLELAWKQGISGQDPKVMLRKGDLDLSYTLHF